ncbi:NADPH-dependent FMN reductase [Variovorax sp. RKNM96]|uniref:NADPH-dependent FMN reductase n=1 Tax=Variovorax sp. RKNM96 TaxID=2681552 RepID=UPI0019804544|nr:NAD(P)H-dependent oxidoreductase [Variovorax sp. RKNM96]QSI33282.1 NADPH-dependent FMN reductase [Variovorax sp. RKNM96]
MKPRLHTLICTTRPGRLGPAIAEWAHEFAQAHGRFDSTLVDLAEFSLPVFDEPEHPRLQQYIHAHTKAWSASVAAADAFLFVMPEYNHGPPGALINAMNYLVREWQYKPVGFVSYGGVSGGLRGVQATKQLMSTLKLVPIPEAIVVPNFTQHVEADGRFVPNELHTASGMAMLEELHRWTRALAALRVEARPEELG